MSISTAAAPHASGGRFAAFHAAFRFSGSSLLIPAETGPRRMAAVDWLNKQSDKDLAQRGTTPEAEVNRIFGP